MIITIDGPAASGKSSVARALAKKFDFFYLYTGLLYRAVAFILLKYEKHAIDLNQPCTLTRNELEFLRYVEYVYEDGKARIIFKGNDITSFLSDASLDQVTSFVSASPVVREALLKFQQQIAEYHDVIADGRDCGSVIFPHADLKFFLTASVEARALRVMTDAARKAKHLDCEAVREEIVKRDNRDAQRTIAPLVIPKGAVVVDNSSMTLEQTIDIFAKRIEEIKK